MADWRDAWWDGPTVARLAERWRLDEVTDALDVGCGDGFWGQTLAPTLSAGARVTGVDLHAAFDGVSTARAQGGPWRFEQGAAEALPFPDGRFDLVTGRAVLLHLPDPTVAVAEMVRVLRPGGRIALVEPDNLAVADDDGFQAICEEGSRRLGEGDPSVGARLAGVLRGMGLIEVVDDRMVRQRPVDPQEQAWWAGELTPHGTQGDALRRWIAGGGEAGAFEAAWVALLGRQRQVAAALGRGERVELTTVFHHVTGVLGRW